MWGDRAFQGQLTGLQGVVDQFASSIDASGPADAPLRHPIPHFARPPLTLTGRAACYNFHKLRGGEPYDLCGPVHPAP